MVHNPAKCGQGRLNPLFSPGEPSVGVSPIAMNDSAVSPGPDTALGKSVPSQQNPQLRQISDSLLSGVRGGFAIIYLLEALRGDYQKGRERFGGPEGIRTLDLFHAMEARSQLRHRPTNNCFEIITSVRCRYNWTIIIESRRPNLTHGPRKICLDRQNSAVSRFDSICFGRILQ